MEGREIVTDSPNTTERPPRVRLTMMEPEHNEADFLTQYLPAVAGDSSQDPPLIRETERVLKLAYAWGQIRIAQASLASAYNTWKDFDKQDLPIRSIKQGMRGIRKLVKETAALVHEGRSEGTAGETAGQTETEHLEEES